MAHTLQDDQEILSSPKTNGFPPDDQTFDEMQDWFSGQNQLIQEKLEHDLERCRVWG